MTGVDSALDPNRELRDQSLVKRACAGDERAYELLILLYQGRIANLLRQYFPGDEQTVEDVLQEVFLKVWSALRNFRSESSFYTWLYSISLNTARTHLASLGRKRGREVALEDEQTQQIEDVSELGHPEHRYEQADQRAMVTEALNAMPDSIREPLYLRGQGFAYKEISEMMAVPLNTVRTRIFRGRKMLEKLLAAPAAARSDSGHVA